MNFQKNHGQQTRRRERGVAVIVVLTLLSLILVYIAANAKTLYHLGRELKLLDTRQLRHWAVQSSDTNSVPRTNAPPAAATPTTPPR